MGKWPHEINVQLMDDFCYAKIFISIVITENN